MDKFIEFKRFTDIESAVEITAILDDKEIAYELDDKSVGFSLVSSDINPYENQIILKIKETDFNKVDVLINDNAKKETINVDEDHYLYSFSDKDIIDIIANQDNWTRLEVNLALQIAKKRNLDLSADSIKLAKHIEPEKTNKKIPIDKIASWYLTIAIFVFLNTLFEVLMIKFRFLDLNIKQIIIKTLDIIFGKIILLELLTSLMFSLVFLIIWYYSKQKNRFFYITGFVIYSIDTIVTLKYSNWFDIALHLFVLFMLTPGLSKKNVA